MTPANIGLFTEMRRVQEHIFSGGKIVTAQQAQRSPCFFLVATQCVARSVTALQKMVHRSRSLSLLQYLPHDVLYLIISSTLFCYLYTLRLDERVKHRQPCSQPINARAQLPSIVQSWSRGWTRTSISFQNEERAHMPLTMQLLLELLAGPSWSYIRHPCLSPGP